MITVTRKMKCQRRVRSHLWISLLKIISCTQGHSEQDRASTSISVQLKLLGTEDLNLVRRWWPPLNGHLRLSASKSRGYELK